MKRALVLLVVASLCGVGAARAEWQVTQLTDNSYDDYIEMGSHCGPGIVWEGFDGNDKEIFYYDGNDVMQLTDNDGIDKTARICGSDVVWAGWDGNDYEIYLYDGVTTTQLTDNDYSDWRPVISATHLAWCVPDKIHYYDGSSVTELPYTALEMQISGANLAWRTGVADDSEIFYYDGNAVTQLTGDGTKNNYHLQISGSNVVWDADVPTGVVGNKDIFLYDGNTTANITNSDYPDSVAYIDGSTAVWYTLDPNDDDYEILMYDGNSVTQLTDNDTYDQDPVVYGHLIAWVGVEITDPGWNYEVFLYDGNSIVTLTDTDYNESNVFIAGDSRIAWSANDGNDREIFVAEYIVPEPAALSLTALGGLALMRRRNKGVNGA